MRTLEETSDLIEKASEEVNEKIKKIKKRVNNRKTHWEPSLRQVLSDRIDRAIFATSCKYGIDPDHLKRVLDI